MSETTFDGQLDFEARLHETFFLPLYAQRGWMVVEDNLGKNTPFDVVLERDGKKYAIDEKALRKPWDGMVVELVQHIGNTKGSWLHHEKDAYIYAECVNSEPTRLHIVSHAKLRDAVFDKAFWERHRLKPQVSLKGYGITVFVVVKWEVLINEGIASNIPL